MSVHLLEQITAGLPEECRLLDQVTVRLIEPSERELFDQRMSEEHYLKNATAVGQVLRYAAEYDGQWVALLTFSSAAYHLKPRDRWLKWVPREVAQRRHLVAQNSRFLVLAATRRWPNLASRVLKLTCERLPQDWERHYGHPVLAVETFVDPHRFRGTCYKAAGWQRLGATQGCERDWQDFYTDTKNPKELWVRAMSPEALDQLRAPELPAHLRPSQGPLPPSCPVETEQLGSLWECFRDRLSDPRNPKGKRHQLATVLTLIALAVSAGCKNPHAVSEFANSLNHGQRRQLRCRPRLGTRRQFDVPSERTFRRLLKLVEPGQLKDVVVSWMKKEDPQPLEFMHADGKVLKNADPAPARALPQIENEIPVEQQKPKADKALTLVNFTTSGQRLIDQIAVPRDTNEEAAVAAHWSQMDLAGVCVGTDAAHTTKANARQLTQDNGAEYFFPIKANQPNALAKAQQLLSGSFPPSGPNTGLGPRQG